MVTRGRHLKRLEGLLQRHPVVAVDRESAHETLTARAAQAAEDAHRIAETAERDTPSSMRTPRSKAGRGSSRRQGIGEAMAKSVVRSLGSQIGRQIVRGILGSLFRGR